MIYLLNNGEWSKPPVLTGARQLLFKRLIGEHRTVTLGETADFVNGTSYDKSQLVEGGVPIIRISNITNPASPYLETEETFADKFMAKAGDLLVSWSASFKSIIWAGPDAVVNQHIFRVRPKEGTDRRYLRHAIEASLEEMLESSVGMGMKHLRRADFLGHQIPLPARADQEAIGAFLDSLEEGDWKAALPPKYRDIETRVRALSEALYKANIIRLQFEQQADDLATLRTRILEDAVQGRLTQRESDDEPASKLRERIAAEKQRLHKVGKISKPKMLPPVTEDELPFEVPEGWEWMRFGDAVAEGPTNGYSPKGVDFETPVKALTLASTSSGRFDPSHFKYLDIAVEADSDLWLRHGDVLVQRGNSREYVGISAMYDGPDRAFVYPDLMMRCRMHQAVLPSYAVSVLQTPWARSFMNDRSSGTSSTMPKINQATLRLVPFPLPPFEEQRRIVSRINELMALCNQLQTRLKSARTDAERLTAAVLEEALEAGEAQT